MRRLCAALVAAPLLFAATPAAARPASRATVHELARRAAAGDAGALARLRSVTSVDGVPMALGRALGGSSAISGAGDLLRRLTRLAAETGGPAPTGGGASSDPAGDAQRILAGSRYRETSLPRPLHGFLHVLGEHVVRPVVEALDRLVPGSSSVVWALLGLLVVAGAVALSGLLLRQRGARSPGSPGESPASSGPTPEALELAADAAQRRGELERALRLRLQAGLLRLDRQGAIELRDSTTTGQVSDTLGSAAFAELARRHGEVVYGGRPADDEDLEATRSALTGAGRRSSGRGSRR